MDLSELFNNLFGFGENDENSFPNLDKFENKIRNEASGKVSVTTYEENGLVVTKEEYKSEDGKIYWSKTSYSPKESNTEVINSLKKELQQAIDNQEFEKAAIIRDKIKENLTKTN